MRKILNYSIDGIAADDIMKISLSDNDYQFLQKFT